MDPHLVSSASADLVWTVTEADVVVALDEDKRVGAKNLLGEHFQSVALEAEPEEAVVGENLVPQEHLRQPPIDGNVKEFVDSNDGIVGVSRNNDVSILNGQLAVPATYPQFSSAGHHQLCP